MGTLRKESLFHYVKNGLDYVLFYPKYHEDDRRRGWFDIFFGEISYSNIKNINIVHIPHTNTLVAWHKHKNQTDLWFVPQGRLMAGVAYKEETSNKIEHDFVSLSPQTGGVLIIPPNTWHGYKTLEPNTILIYGITQEYDPEDELRASLEDLQIDWDLGVR